MTKYRLLRWDRERHLQQRTFMTSNSVLSPKCLNVPSLKAIEVLLDPTRHSFGTYSRHWITARNSQINRREENLAETPLVFSRKIPRVPRKIKWCCCSSVSNYFDFFSLWRRRKRRNFSLNKAHISLSQQLNKIIINKKSEILKPLFFRKCKNFRAFRTVFTFLLPST